VPSDGHVLQAVREQKGVAELYPDSPASKAYRATARILMDRVPLQKCGFAAFWEKLIHA
jgi:flagellar biosynthesis protein FlhG